MVHIYCKKIYLTYTEHTYMSHTSILHKMGAAEDPLIPQQANETLPDNPSHQHLATYLSCV